MFQASLTVFRGPTFKFQVGSNLILSNFILTDLKVQCSSQAQRQKNLQLYQNTPCQRYSPRTTHFGGLNLYNEFYQNLLDEGLSSFLFFNSAPLESKVLMYQERMGLHNTQR